MDLLVAAAQLPNLSIVFSASPTAIDCATQTVEIEGKRASAMLIDESFSLLKTLKPSLAAKGRNKAKTMRSEPYDLLIGADGSSSQVRSPTAPHWVVSNAVPYHHVSATVLPPRAVSCDGRVSTRPRLGLEMLG